MRKKKNKNTQPKKELPNIYGRKPSKIIAPDTENPSVYRFLGEFPSRRQARKHRAKVCEEFQLKTYETRIVPNGAQLPF